MDTYLVKHFYWHIEGRKEISWPLEHGSSHQQAVVEPRFESDLILWQLGSFFHRLENPRYFSRLNTNNSKATLSDSFDLRHRIPSLSTRTMMKSPLTTQSLIIVALHQLLNSQHLYLLWLLLKLCYPTRHWMNHCVYLRGVGAGVAGVAIATPKKDQG